MTDGHFSLLLYLALLLRPRPRVHAAQFRPRTRGRRQERRGSLSGSWRPREDGRHAHGHAGVDATIF
jgi:hypothetical protein